uniref:Secreted protein n=1 Tax=Achlya hypogyna TaxID=1202772 RepID=A0A0A7CP19_ACHHY|nr:secreted protein [Achlya hypogyna]
MKLASTLILTVAALTKAQTPGQCKSTPDCAQYGSGYTCVAVQTAIAGIALASQCVLGTTCGGNTPGQCPTFSSWSSKYQKIQPVCAFTNVTNCVAPIKAGDTASSASGSTSVNCYQATFTVNNITQVVNGIYKCVDSGLYVSQNLGAITNLTTTQMDVCAGNVSTSGGALCNGHGTCAPSSPFSSKYQCICNEGYSPSDNCNIAVSNVCNAFGSCGAGNTCDTSSKQCSCSTGTKGPQCSLCDSTAPAANQCNGNGVCNAAGACTCNTGYTGSLCQKYAPSTGGSGSGKTGNTGNTRQLTLSLAFVVVGAYAALT